MDCTGLIPALPQSDAELEAYNQMYRFIPEPPDGVSDSPKIQKTGGNTWA